MKIRLDELLVQRRLSPDLAKARAMIGAGEVYVNDEISDKAGKPCPADAEIRVKGKCRYVSRGGLKLEHGLDHFQVSPQDLCCADIGASSGGFTDCLLQHGAARVYAIDVAYGQLDWKIRQDPRVVVMERFNARKIQPADLAEPIELAVMDTSFISITSIIPALLPLFKDKVRILALIKPQFELPKAKVGKGGVVRDPELHQQAVTKIERFATEHGLVSSGVTPSPILGPKGNTEFLIYLTRISHEHFIKI